MLSIELSRKLKNAELEWEPKELDCMSAPADVCTSAYLGKEEMEEIQSFSNEEMKTLQEKIVWLPRLDQLLAEIERRGYNYELTCGLSSSHKYIIHLFKGDYVLKRKYGNALDDVIAQALIWVLEREKEAKQSG